VLPFLFCIAAAAIVAATKTKGSDVTAVAIEVAS
jgi:hypothetical protein